MQSKAFHDLLALHLNDPTNDWPASLSLRWCEHARILPNRTVNVRNLAKCKGRLCLPINGLPDDWRSGLHSFPGDRESILKRWICGRLWLRRRTLIIMWDVLLLPSAESRFPGRPADSQFEQMSMDSQIAQWKRAPRISSMQLYLHE
jgi:hypothetical protein